MVIIFKSITFLFCLTIFSLAHGAESFLKTNTDTKRILLAKASSKSSVTKTSPPKSSATEPSKTGRYCLPDVSANKSLAKGVILVLHYWPDAKQEKDILERLNSESLEKKSEIERFKVLVFEWTKPHKDKKAKKLCKKLSNVPYLKHCEPDYMTVPAVEGGANKKQETLNEEGTNYIMLRNWVNNRGLSIANAIHFLDRKNIPILQINNPEVPALRAAGKSYSPTIHAIPNTSENMRILNQFAEGQQSESQQPESQKVKTLDMPLRQNSQPAFDPNTMGNLRSCDIVSSQVGFFNGKLSDYWGQELIGADLLKEELEKTDVPDKHLAEAVDSKERNHDEKVRNLISDQGKHSVLPEIGDKAGITNVYYVSDMLRETNRLLDKVDDTCSAENSNTDSSSHTSSQQQRDSNNQDSSQQQRDSNDQDSSQQQRDSNNQDSSQQQRDSNDQDSSQKQRSNSQTTSQEQETTTHDGTEYLMLSNWANNRNFELGNVIGFLGREEIDIEYIDSPYIEGLKAAGESWSPTVHVIPNTESNRTKLQQYATQRGQTVYSRTLTVKWKTATNWNQDWQGQKDDLPSAYDLEASYEVDKSKSGLYARKYKYIFRRPVLDMRGKASISTELFNWLPPIVLLNKNNVRKLKIWGTKEVGNGTITINGVSLTMTEVPGTISDVPGSAMRHGRWEADLTQTQFNTIYNAGL